MSWPPPTLATNRTNTDLQQNTHPADHNAANLAINDITSHIKGEKVVRSGRLDIANDGSTGLFAIRFTDLIWDSVVIQMIVPWDTHAFHSGNSEGPGANQSSAYFFFVYYYNGTMLPPGASCAFHYIATGTAYP